MNSDWLIGGAALAAVSAGWSHIRALWQYLTSWLVIRAQIDGDMTESLGFYLKHIKAVPSRYGTRTYGGTCVTTIARELRSVLFEYWLSGRVIWLGRWPMLVSMDASNNGNSNAPQTAGPTIPRFTLHAIRGTVDVEALLRAALKLSDDRRRGTASRFRVVPHFGQHQRQRNNQPSFARESLGTDKFFNKLGRLYELPGSWLACDDATSHVEPMSELSLDGMVLNDEAWQAVQLIRAWYANEHWYRERAIPWQLGLCLHGSPGNGKSTLIKTVASELRVPVHVLDLSTMDNRDLHEAWSIAQEQAPVVIVLEDFHSVFVGDMPVGGTGVTMDAILQHASGLDGTGGVLLFVTTNVLAHMSPALLRPGRLDVHLEMPVPDASGRAKLAARVLRDQPELIEGMVQMTEGLSCVAVQQRCIEAALVARHAQVFKGVQHDDRNRASAGSTDATLVGVCAGERVQQEAGPDS